MSKKKKTDDPLSYIAEPLRPLAVSIESLILDPKNARKHDERNLKAIEASLKRFGQRIAIVVQRDGMIVRAGNGRVLAAKALGWTHIAAVMVDDANSEAVAFALTDNRTAELAEWDDDVLAELLKEIGDDDAELMELMEDVLPDLTEDVGEGGPIYTNKIVAPIYEPKGERPPVSEMIDRKKTEELLSEIELAGLPEEVGAFLRFAAERHTVFNFRQIAEFYCHADSKIQDLMERSGLVIIDFKKAIEYGFVHLTERLGALADQEEFHEG